MLVCLDVDGCLIDSDVPILRALNDALESMELGIVTLDDVRPHLGPPLLVTLDRLLVASGAEGRLAPELARRYRQAYSSVSVTHAASHDGMREALAVLRAEGHALVVVSSKPAEYSRPVLEVAGLLELFDEVFGPEGEESEPKAWTLARALSRSGEPPAVMVGDTAQDIAAARANRVPCVAVSWGYGDAAELRQLQPAALVDTAEDLVGAVRAVASENSSLNGWRHAYSSDGDRFSYDELLVIHELVVGRLRRRGRLHGLISSGVDQQAGVVEIRLKPDHDVSALAAVLDGLPQAALEVQLQDGGWRGSAQTGSSP